jgi:integrase
MPTIFQTFDRNGKPHHNWRFKYINYKGERKTATGLPTKESTKRLAWKIQAEQDEIRKGLRPPPKESEIPRAFEEVVAEYLAWGESQGGRGGRPWSGTHLEPRQRHLAFWQKRLSLIYLSDLTGILPKVEAALREMQNKGRAGKTLQNYAEALAALCDWAIKRHYLESDPLKDLQKFDTTPETTRRALTADEVNRFLAAARPERRLLFEIALATGLRANELRSLCVKHLDANANGLRLESGWTKGRKATFQPLHPTFVGKLVESTKNLDASAPLLFVPKMTAKVVYRTLEVAGIPKVTAEGKVDFHALRTAYTTFVFEAGASMKEAQTLARHATPDLTLNVYARARSDRLSELARAVGDRVCAGNGGCTTGVQWPPLSISVPDANACGSEACADSGAKRPEGSSPCEPAKSNRAQTGQGPTFLGLHVSQVGQPQDVGHAVVVEGRTTSCSTSDAFDQRRCPMDVQLILKSSGVFGFSVEPSADLPSFSVKAA